MNFSDYNFSPSDLELAQKSVKIKTFNHQKILYNDYCHGFIFVKSGQIKAFKTSENGKEILLFKLNPGDECLLCTDCINVLMQNLILKISENTCIEILPSEIFKNLKDKYPLFAKHILALLSQRFAKSMEVMSAILFIPLKSRVVDFLQNHAKENVITMTHEQIANEIFSAREAVSRILKELENENFLRLERGKIILL